MPIVPDELGVDAFVETTTQNGKYIRWCPELEEALAAPFPEECHKTLPKGGTDITFVSVWDYVHRLNELVGPHGWQDHVTLHDAGGRLIATVELSILDVTKTNVGDEAEDKEGYGTAATNAWAQGLKRAASLFGLGLYLYDKDGRGAAPKRKPQTEAVGGSEVASGGPPSECLPSGQYEGKHVSDPKIPRAYLISRLDDLKKRQTQESLRWQKLIERELERRATKAS